MKGRFSSGKQRCRQEDLPCVEQQIELNNNGTISPRQRDDRQSRDSPALSVQLCLGDC